MIGESTADTDASITHLDKEDDIIILLETDTSTTLILAVRDRIVRQKTEEQMQNRPFTMGFHHGSINPLPSTSKYPNMNILTLVTLWLMMGNKNDCLPPLRRLTTPNVRHFDNEGRNLSKMRKVMGLVQSFAR